MLNLDIDIEEIEALEKESAKSIISQLATNGTAHTKDNYINHTISTKLPELRRPKENPKLIMANDRRSRYSVISFNVSRYLPDIEKNMSKDLKKLIKIFR